MSNVETNVEVPRQDMPDQPPKGTLTKFRTVLTVMVGLLFFALALHFIRRELGDYSISAVIDSVRNIPVQSLIFSLIAMVISFAGISCYDYLALKYIEKDIPLRKTAFASFCAYSISNTLGLSVLTGNAVRYRLYSSWGLGALDVAVIAFVTTAFLFMSGLFVTAVGLILDNDLFDRVFGIPAALAIVIGIVILLGVIGGIAAFVTGPEKRVIRKITVERPPKGRAILQMGVGIVDWIAAAAVLYFLLPVSPDFLFWTFVPVFITAHYLGAMSGLPGGIGVFEAVMLLLVPGGNMVDVAGALVAYRAIYYILPLILSAIMLTGHQALQSKKTLLKGRDRATDFLEVIAPTLYAVLTFVVGAVMLISAATPGLAADLALVAKFVPMSIMNASHLLASAIGTLLLLAAMGLRRRLYNGWVLTVALFTAGAVFTFLKGGDPLGAILMLVLAVCLYVSKDAFYRKGRISQIRLSLPRLGLLLATITFAVWSGFYAYKSTDYSSSLWWDFTLQADASRFLRAMVIVGAILTVYVLWRLLAPPPALKTIDRSDAFLQKVREIILNSEGAGAEVNLALLGDKQFLFSESGKSFIMYGVKGRNWVAMGEPVGLMSERKELLWQFRQLADLWDAWPSFYSVRSDNLADFVDLGLTVQKIGELALVPIEGFTLEGPKRAKFRHARNKGVREGMSFEVVQLAETSPEMLEVEAVSDDWLRDHQGKEKGFSLGRFDAKVLSQQPIALIRREGKIIAFANLWTTPQKSEVSLDLMRYKNIGVNGIMDFLFAEIMVWASAEGYSYFSLGLAPLSGLEAHKLAPLMSKLGAMIFKYGGKIYGFEGLRAFKEKFSPEWEPVYLAAPSQLVMPQALGNLALLSSGGVLGLLQRES